VVNPQDAVSRERTLKLGKRRFKRFQKWLNKQGKQVEAPQQQQQQQELESAAKQPPESGDTKESSDTTASSTAQNTETVTSPLELIKDILNATDYLDRYDRKDPDDVQRLENVKELMNIAAQFQDPIIFLENVSLVQDNQLKDVAREDSTGAEATNQAQRHQAQRQSRGQVSMMSLHSAKGLEFPVVFIVGMEEKLLPHSRCMFDAEQIEEERRLCYVGITRAKRKLYLSYANQRWLYGRSRQAKPSRFLQQIPDRLTVKRQSSPNLGQSNDWKKRKKAHKSNANQLNDRAFDPDSPELDALLKEEIDIDEFLAS
jgi:DNA helicase-2/ATP-dependent DNA helicase PcrA